LPSFIYRFCDKGSLAQTVRASDSSRIILWKYSKNYQRCLP